MPVVSFSDFPTLRVPMPGLRPLPGRNWGILVAHQSSTSGRPKWDTIPRGPFRTGVRRRHRCLILHGVSPNGPPAEAGPPRDVKVARCAHGPSMAAGDVWKEASGSSNVEPILACGPSVLRLSDSTPGGTRTPTSSRTYDFESHASTSSATGAGGCGRGRIVSLGRATIHVSVM